MLAAGHRVFGENYVQESKRKWPDLRERYPGVELHLIGPLQSNKARDAVQLFDAIQTLDRESLARELAKEIERTGQEAAAFRSGEYRRRAAEGRSRAAGCRSFLELCRRTYSLTSMGSWRFRQPTTSFSSFRPAREQGENVRLRRCLSMGMSADFAQAIMLGATHVRIGTAIFGRGCQDKCVYSI